MPHPLPPLERTAPEQPAFGSESESVASSEPDIEGQGQAAAKSLEFKGEASTLCVQCEVLTSPRAPAPVPAQPFCDAEVEAPDEAGEVAESGLAQHQVKADGDITAHIRLLRAEAFPKLRTPLQRMQEVPADAFGLPQAGDIVVAVSHAWRNQAHPDPGGEKKEILRAVLEEIWTSEVGREVFIFLDFISISQRPFRVQQPPRTELESFSFKAALACMHRMYFLSDRIIHLPWESQSSQVAGEGEEYEVPASYLEGAQFMQTRDAVQVAEPPVGSEEVYLFDEVVTLDNEPVTSVAGLEAELATAASVTLRRYPFGLVNAVPADERGWVYLERFITMVKCAMMDEAAASRAVITSCPGIRRQITEGAGRLRAAAARDKSAPGALWQELCRFEAELRAKRFSAASLDKRQMMGGGDAAQKDQAVVCRIMEEFVSHLSGHWEAEAQRQRGFANRLAAMVAATEALFGEWDSFSPAYRDQVARAAEERSAAPLLLFLAAPLVTMLPIAFAVGDPDEPWQSQKLFWCWMLPGIAFFVFIALCEIILKASRVHHSWPRLAALGVIVAYLCIGMDAAVESALETFPVPFFGFLQGAQLTVAAPLSYFCIEAGERAQPTFRRRMVLSTVGAVLVVIFCWGPLLLLLAALDVLPLAWQILLVLGFFLVKLSFEMMGKKLARTLGADAMPVYLLCAVSCYQTALCFAFTRVSHWLIALETISLDAMENIYYCWSLRRKARSLSSEQRQYLLASLALREFLELLVPVQFTLLYLFLSRTNRQGFSIFCTENGYDHLAYLALDVVVEAIISFLTWRLLAQDGHAPIAALKGILLVEYSSFITIGAPMVSTFFAVHHSHIGMDLSFQVLWLRDGYRWSCGLTWLAVT